MPALKNPKFQFAFFLIVFFVINLAQSLFTGLFEDEAYYWVWSNNLAWGYFDHPPMVAFFIWLGGWFFEGELGVRIISVLSFSLLLCILWELLDMENKRRYVALFFLMVISVALIQVFGFISTPDTPLLLFTALFFWAYRRYLNGPGLLSAILLGASMAALMYSKYHAVLVIGFVLLSNLKLLKNKYFWLAVITSLVLYVPHLFWQYQNGFPSFEYHLKERGHRSYHIGHSLNHLFNMMVVLGITFPVIYHAFIKKKTLSDLERSYKFVVYGFVIFFFFSTFKSSPQAQWLLAMLVPLLLVSFPYIAAHEGSKKWLIRLGLAQLTIVVIARVLLAVPELSPVELEPHLAKHWVPEVREKTDDAPLVFINSYTKAAIYQFNTGIDTHSYGIPEGRKSQYDLLDTESGMQGRTVYGVGKRLSGHQYLTTKGGDDLFGMKIDSFYSFQDVQVTLQKDRLHLSGEKNLIISFKMTNPYEEALHFERVEIFGIFQDKKKRLISRIPLEVKDLNTLPPLGSRMCTGQLTVPEIPEQKGVTFRIGISFEGLPPGIQGDRIPVVFESVQN